MGVQKFLILKSGAFGAAFFSAIRPSALARATYRLTPPALEWPLVSLPRMGSPRVSLWSPSIFRPLTRIFQLFPRKCDFFRTSPLFPRCFQLSPSTPPTFPRFSQGFSYFANGFPIFPRVFLFFSEGFPIFPRVFLF